MHFYLYGGTIGDDRMSNAAHRIGRLAFWLAMSALCVGVSLVAFLVMCVNPTITIHFDLNLWATAVFTFFRIGISYTQVDFSNSS